MTLLTDRNDPNRQQGDTFLNSSGRLERLIESGVSDIWTEVDEQGASGVSIAYPQIEGTYVTESEGPDQAGNLPIVFPRIRFIDVAGVEFIGVYDDDQITIDLSVEQPSDTIESVVVSGLLQTEATIMWNVFDLEGNEGLLSGVVSYGTDPLALTDTAELPDASSHSVVLSGLSPETEYHYKVSGTDPETQQLVETEVYTFSTLAAGLSVPSIICPTETIGTVDYDALIDDPNPPAIRNYDFRANDVDAGPSVQNQLSFPITNIGQYGNPVELRLFYWDDNDLTTITEVPGRCTVNLDSGETISSEWLGGNLVGMNSLTNLRQNANPQVSCLFTNRTHTSISSIKMHTTARTLSYYGGDGGTFKIHLATANADGTPNVILGSTPTYVGDTFNQTQSQAASRYPGAVWSSHGETGNELHMHRIYDFANPIAVTPNTKYCWICERTSSFGNYVSVNCAFTNNDAAARWTATSENNDEWKTWSSSNGSNWTKFNNRLGIFDIRGNGMVVGCGINEVAAGPNPDRGHNVNSGQSIRQKWVPEYSTAAIDNIRIRAARRSGSGPLTVQIKDSSNNVLASGSVTSVVSTSQNSVLALNQSLGAYKIDMDNNPTIQVGSTYYIELSTTGSNDFEVASQKDGVKDRNYLVDTRYHGFGVNSHMQVNNGSGWVNPLNWGNRVDSMDLELGIFSA